MPSTYTAELARKASGWILYATVEGWGRRVGAVGSALQGAYRLATRDPYSLGCTAIEADPYLPCLDSPGYVLDESIDVREGKTSSGTLALHAADMPVRERGLAAHGWGDGTITDLIAISGPAHASHAATGGVWKLAADLSAVAVSMTLVSTAGLAAGDALWIGSEVVVVTGFGGPGAVSIARACHGTTATAHRTAANGGEGFLYDRPKHLRSRAVSLYAALRDSTTGELQDPAQHRLLWTGRVDDWRLSQDGLVYEIACSGSLGYLDRTIGRGQVRGKVARTLLEGVSQTDQQWFFDLARPADPAGTLGSGVPDYPSGEFYARLGDRVVRCRAISDVTGLAARFVVEAWGLLGTDATPPDSSETFCDVVLSHPSPGDDSPIQLFTTPAGNPATHPLDLLLTMITSTGAYHGAGANGDADSLPADWGLGRLVSTIDLESFNRLRSRHLPLSYSRAVLGWDGKGVRVREWAEEEVFGPLSWFFVPSSDGRLAVGEIRDLYPLDSPGTITTADIVIDGGLPAIQVGGDLGSTTTWSTWRMGYLPGDDDDPALTIRYRSQEVAERMPQDDSEIAWDMTAVDPGSALGTIHAIAVSTAERRAFPLPAVTVTVGLHKAELVLTSPVLVTLPMVPNPLTGERGLTRAPAAVIGRAIDFDAGTITLRLLLLREYDTGHWAPSLEVVSAVGSPPTIDVAQSSYSNAALGGGLPTLDVDAFAVGDLVMLVDQDGAPLCDNAVAITAVNYVGPPTDSINIFADFTLLGAPVLPSAGDRIVYAHWNTGGTPSAVWTATMQESVAQADETTQALPDGSAPYVYGG